MYFILSKLLLPLILPLNWILVSLMLAIFLKKPKLKCRFLVLASVLLYLFTIPVLIDQFARRWDIRPDPLKQPTYSCAIVLGGFAGEDASGQGRFNGAADRFIQGVKLLKTGKVSHILISGGNGSLVPDKFEESNWVKTQLQALQVPDSCIVIENRSRNTKENAAFSQQILLKSHLQPPYVLVTSAFHMRRSLAIFKKAGTSVVPYPCNYIAGIDNVTADRFIPDAEVLGRWNYYTKEVVGYVVNK